MSVLRQAKASALEQIWVEENYPEGRVAARVPMRRDPRTGELSYTSGALRALDRLRAVLQDVSRSSSSGHLKCLREALGMTQQQFAQRLGVSNQTVSRWERGEARPGAAMLPRVRKLQAQARRRGIRVPTIARTAATSR